MDDARIAEIRARWNGVVPDPWIAAERDVADLLAEVERLTELVEKAMERQKYWRYVFDLLTGNKGGKNIGQVISDHLDWLEDVGARTVDE